MSRAVPARGGTLAQESRSVVRMSADWIVRWLSTTTTPSIEPDVARNLRLAQQALDVAETLKYNAREDNAETLAQVRTLLRVGEQP